MEDFTPHSCRSASATETSNRNLDTLGILRKACWSNAKTFLQFHKKILRYEGIDLRKIMEH